MREETIVERSIEDSNHLSQYHESLSSLSRHSLSHKNYLVPVKTPECPDKSGLSWSRKWLILLTLAYGNFCSSACVSLQAPFFPKEAELKHATPTQYGFVFGVYELAICLTSPLFGKMVDILIDSNN